MADLLIHAHCRINADIADVWTSLLDADFVGGLFTLPFDAKLLAFDRKSAGRVHIAGEQYDARFVPYTAKLTNADRYITVELSDAEAGGCDVALSVLSLNDADAACFTQPMLDGFLVRLRTAMDGGLPGAAPADRGADASDAPAVRAASTDGAPPERTDGPSAEGKKHKHGRALRILAGALAAVLLLTGAYAVLYPVAYRYFSGASANTAASVNLSSAAQLLPGMSRNEVERTLGSIGRKHGDGILYEGAARTGDGLAAEQVYVLYDDYIAQSITYLDLTAARAVGTIEVKSADYPADQLTVEGIAAIAGSPVSMLRRYRNGGDEMLEVHFGRADCFANFDPAWRGEYVVTANLTKKTASDRNWVGYDGGDPLMLASLDGTPAAAQYDSYTDFLNDKFVFDEALLALNHYSRGDAKRIFAAQDMQLYDDTLLGGTYLYSHSAGDADESGSVPYRYVFGFDSAGRFRAFSFANMRLYEKRGTLAGTQYEAVTKGMSYNEVCALVPILPTALFVDESYFTVCYGRYVAVNGMEGQFEFIVRFDIENNYAQNIYNNVTKAAAEDAQTQNPAEDAADNTVPDAVPDETQGATE
ncbi:MAG: hypothetical protein VB092_00505 [Oscillospiraceae bacterium]|nr:hypothetical protein [Oscillospiraceae bacterium]